MFDPDAFRAATLVMDRHGDGADLYAAQRVFDLAAEGDVTGSVVWKQILSAITAIAAPGKPGEFFN